MQFFVWDTRQVLEEGTYKNLVGTLGPGRGDGKFDSWRYARDNAKPLVGAKHNYVFDSDDLPLQPLKITKVGVVSGRMRVYDTNAEGTWEVGTTINGIPVGFTIESSRFGVIRHGVQVVNKVDVAGKVMSLFAKGRGTVGYYGTAISFEPKLTPVGKSQQFIGQTYKIDSSFAKTFIDKFVAYANEHPESFNPAFKKAIGCGMQ